MTKIVEYLLIGAIKVNDVVHWLSSEVYGMSDDLQELLDYVSFEYFDGGDKW